MPSQMQSNLDKQQPNLKVIRKEENSYANQAQIDELLAKIKKIEAEKQALVAEKQELITKNNYLNVKSNNQEAKIQILTQENQTQSTKLRE